MDENICTTVALVTFAHDFDSIRHGSIATGISRSARIGISSNSFNVVKNVKAKKSRIPCKELSRSR